MFERRNETNDTREELLSKFINKKEWILYHAHFPVFSVYYGANISIQT
jgi:hypothetical protein